MLSGLGDSPILPKLVRVGYSLIGHVRGKIRTLGLPLATGRGYKNGLWKMPKRLPQAERFTPS